MSDFKRGDRVRITTPKLGTIRWDNPRYFTAHTVGVGDEGQVVDAENLPDGWLLVRMDVEHDGPLYAPVEPRMIEKIEP